MIANDICKCDNKRRTMRKKYDWTSNECVGASWNCKTRTQLILGHNFCQLFNKQTMLHDRACSDSQLVGLCALILRDGALTHSLEVVVTGGCSP